MLLGGGALGGLNQSETQAQDRAPAGLGNSQESKSQQENNETSETMISATELHISESQQAESIVCRIEANQFLNLEEYKLYTCSQCYK